MNPMTVFNFLIMFKKLKKSESTTAKVAIGGSSSTNMTPGILVLADIIKR
ncbi:hypothetical protein M2372_003538 [Chryseobacterium sp. BIGb0232]|nr:hypothetical protein [Chryseobacterium sp. BIGb0232]ROS17654.1 hypothetical protein EDF65_2028 [Chryseobacterium nakagawai]